VSEQQLKNELESTLCFAKAAYCHSLELGGMAQWMRVQRREELDQQIFAVPTPAEV